MSEHLWVEENLTAHVMGGLEGEERERFEAHVAECSDCARELEAGRNADHKLQELFMAARPSPAMEDQMIQTLRQEPLRRRWFVAPRSFKVAIAAAAAVLLMAAGAGVTSLMEEGGFKFPWAEDANRAQALNNLQAVRGHGLARNMYGGLFPAGTFTPEPEDDLARTYKGRFQTARLEELRQKVQGMDLGGEVKNVDDLALELRDQAEKSVGIVDESRSREAGKRTYGVQSPSLEILGGKPTQGWMYTPAPILGDGADSKGKQPPARGLASGTWVGHPEVPPVAGLGSPPPPPFASPADPSSGESKAGRAGGEWGRKPGTGGLAAEAKPTGESKLGDRAGQADPYYKPTPKPEDLSKGLTSFQRIDKRPSTYFKPADAFAEKNAPKKPEEAGAGEKITLGDGEKAGRRVEGEQRANEKLGDKAEPAPVQKPVASEPQAASRKIIRSGDIEFEVDSFDSAVATIIRLVQVTKGGFVSTINSDKLPNGKVKGSVVVRVPPEELDNLVLGFRSELSKAGELKSQRIGSQDITKQYTDLESRLRAARTMEERLLKIISDGKGAIKDLLQAEKELGVWRTKVEEFEGELRFYSNLVSLSTLNVILAEKEIRSAALVKESERVNAGIEVEDVDKSLREALQAITEHKGRVTRSELKQHSAGQFNALLHFETAPEQAGLLRDRLKQLGNMVRLEIDRVQQAEGGGTAPKDGKIKKGDTQFFVSIYNLANVAPRETVVHRIAAGSVPSSYQKLREAIGKAKGRVVNAQLSEQDPQNVHALVDFDIRRTDEAAILLAIKDAGESITRQVSRVPEGENVTDAKILFRIELVNAANIPPRETVTLKLAAADVPAAYQALRTILTKVAGKVTNAQLNEQDRQNISANLDFSVNKTDESSLDDVFKKTSEVISRHAARQPESAQVSDARVQYRIEIAPASRIPPRETITLAIEVSSVQKVLDEFKKKVTDAEGRTGPVQMALERSGRVTARASFDVPLKDSERVAADFKKVGHVRVEQIAQDQQAPQGKLAIARFDVTLSNEVLVPQDEGLWAQIRQGLSFSMRGLLWSVSFLVIGLLFVLPWVLVVYVVVVLIRKVWRTSAAAQPR